MAARWHGSAFAWGMSSTIRCSAPAPPAELALAREREAVGQRQQAQIDPLVAVELLVESAERRGFGIRLARIGDGAAPQHIVDHDETARPQQPQRALVIAVVVFLVGVDEGKVEASLLPIG